MEYLLKEVTRIPDPVEHDLVSAVEEGDDIHQEVDDPIPFVFEGLPSPISPSSRPGVDNLADLQSVSIYSIYNCETH